MFIYLLAYFVVVNGWLFVLMGIDKKKAQQHKWRIPEKRLLTLGMIGGGFGGLMGMYSFRHKIMVPWFKVVYSLGTIMMVMVCSYFLMGYPK